MCPLFWLVVALPGLSTLRPLSSRKGLLMWWKIGLGLLAFAVIVLVMELLCGAAKLGGPDDPRRR